ncbi:MAG: 30S ribosomal protein S17 [Anaerolineae bacterium]|nr:30S ribosomal protein S17 [Thermoflexales bacterium]MDW8408462.1 30S ribosomal protein S17 [Anaerolineae bacterium]
MSRENRRRMIGVVVSDKTPKTIVVKVDRTLRHPLYRKVLRRSQRYMAHDERDEAKEGDLVQIVESRPLSARKRWLLEQIVRRAGA